jgi:hypothetical protein
MAAGMQVSQVIILPLYAALTGVSLQDVVWRVGDATLATWFALAALLSLVLGMWCGQLGAMPCASAMRVEALAWSPRSAFLFCLATLVLSTFFLALGDLNSGLRQPLLAASRIEWTGVFGLTYVCTAQRRGLIYVLFIACLELLKGFTGIFADFKEVFVVLAIGIVAAAWRRRPRTAVACVVLAGIALTLGAFWSAIKDDYRAYVSLGSWHQVVLVPVEDRLAYLVDRAFKADAQTMRSGFDALARRWGYIDLLSATMRNVPARVPFENGGLVGAAVMHVLQPRLLFPDKPPLPSDTEIAVRYSGIGLDAGGNAVDTSISLGYVAELYVDFGVVGTSAATFLLGFLFGRAVKYLIGSTELPEIVSSGLALVLMMAVASFEVALAKMIGAVVTTFVMILALRKFVFHYLVKKYGPKTGSTTNGAVSRKGQGSAAGAMRAKAAPSY